MKGRWNKTVKIRFKIAIDEKITSLYYGMDNVRKPVVNPFSSDLPGDDDSLMFLSNNYLTSEVPLFVLNSRAMLVIVATNINPKMVGGIELLQIIELVARDTGLPLAAPLLRGYAKVELLTIAELNSFVITAPSRNIEFICTGRVTGVDLEKGWCYVTCSECTKSCSALTPHLHVCDAIMLMLLVLSGIYRIEMDIADDTAEGFFVCFDDVMTKLHNLKASQAGQMLAEKGVNPEDSRMPLFITYMEGKKYGEPSDIHHHTHF
uniref:Replication factor A C-terminal domain-containing protein n=1 Tax=Brassica oleracea var. oleracea TaxID=109376 RepID=A0A0D3BP58_BRAOL